MQRTSINPDQSLTSSISYIGDTDNGYRLLDIYHVKYPISVSKFGVAIL